MNIIKLNAIPSTNDYLKELAVQTQLPDFTVVTTAHQTQGKGQMGQSWLVAPGQNLTFSILLKGSYLAVQHLFLLNVMVANAILEALMSFHLEGLTIKWPNDILSYSKKIGGILIENQFKAEGKLQAIVGIGLNVNQTEFEGLPHASSLMNMYGISLDLDQLMIGIVQNIQKKVMLFATHAAQEWSYYHNHLFRRQVASNFLLPDGTAFTGAIEGVSSEGLLLVRNVDGTLNAYRLKEIQLCY